MTSVSVYTSCHPKFRSGLVSNVHTTNQNLVFVMVTNNFIYLSVTSGPVSGRHTMSVHEGRGPQDGIYVLGRVAQVHINSAPKTRHTGVSSVRSPEEHILNEGGNSSAGGVGLQAQTVNGATVISGTAKPNAQNELQDTEDYFIHQDCISLSKIEAALAEVSERLPLYFTMFTAKHEGWDVHRLSQFPTYVQSLRAEFHSGERVQAAVDAAEDLNYPKCF